MPSRFRHFPRSNERGLIEAVRPMRRRTLGPTTFRAQMIAASLKPITYRAGVGRVNQHFPRSIDRGLIEASLRGRTLDRARLDFPRSIDRGLIEAQAGHENSVGLEDLSAIN